MDGPFYVDSRAPHIAADVAAVTLSTTMLPLMPNSNLPVLGASYFGFIGKAVRLRMWGRMTTGATPGNMQAALYWGNNTAANGTVVVQSAATALVASGTNLTWELEFIVRCRAIGSSGALIGHGMFNANIGLVAAANQPIMLPASAPASVTVDLTQANFLSPQFLRSGSTAETIQVHESVFEAIN